MPSFIWILLDDEADRNGEPVQAFISRMGTCITLAIRRADRTLLKTARFNLNI